jgi:hypothetical protein
MKKEKPKKLSQLLEESGYKTYDMVIDDNKIDLAKHNYVLTRKDDNKQITGTSVLFVEWKEDGTFKSLHTTPAVGRSIIVDPMNYANFKWMTSSITEVISETEFKTQNSTYLLHKI